MNKKPPITLNARNLILIFIILVAIILRFFHFQEIPFTHDEFSALFRTRFDSFAQLINEGVRVDGHPAGVQVFLYYWTRWFGTSELIVKLPFLIMGVLAVFMVYLIGKKWYNETVGLLSAAFMAVLQYPVMYSQIARPYISGLFFSLLLIWFWTMIIKKPNEQFWRKSIGFVFALALCAYNHHFSMLFGGIVWVSGLFLIQKKHVLKYLATGIAAILLYLPHIGIFIDQLRMGGVEGWLAKPSNDFILKYIGYIFHFSPFLMTFVFLLVVVGLLPEFKTTGVRKQFWLFLIWFFLPFLIGFFYSKYVNAVLQYSVLIFSFPFLFYVLFGHIKNQKAWKNAIIVSLILVFGTLTLVMNRQHYRLFYKNIHKQIHVDNPKNKADNDHVFALIHSDKRITEYYLEMDSTLGNFVQYDDFVNEAQFLDYLEQNYWQYDSVYFGGLSSSSPLIVPLIQAYYPKVVWHHTYFGGDTYLFAKGEESFLDIISKNSFENRGKKTGWRGIKQKGFEKSPNDSTNTVYLMHPEMEWGPGCDMRLDTVINHRNNFIDAAVHFKVRHYGQEVLFAVSLKDGDQTIFWNARPLDQFLTKQDSTEWHTAYQTIKLSDIRLKDRNLQLRFFIWNRGKNKVWLDDFKVRLRSGNPVLYGVIQPI